MFNKRIKVGNAPKLTCQEAQKILDGMVISNDQVEAAAHLHSLTCKECLKKYIQEAKDAET
ncbi:hypothetical protein ACFLZ4_01500 [Patescibacteria group bacterium]